MTSWNSKTLKDQLAKQAKEIGIRMPQAQNLLAQERFIARLSKTEFGTKYIWKGGSLVLRAYSTLEIPRYTVDLDLLARGIAVDETKSVFERAVQIQMGDGFMFKEITSRPMERELPYGGERFEISWTLFGNQNSEKLKIDVASGDVVDPRKMTSSELFLCPDADESLSVMVYPPEFILAEKIETMIRFGTGNTRIKDLIDIWSMHRMETEKSKLQTALQRCFTNRESTFDLSEIKSILTDSEYRNFVADAIDRNYSQLKLPQTAILLNDILNWILTLSK